MVDGRSRSECHVVSANTIDTKKLDHFMDREDRFMLIDFWLTSPNLLLYQ